MMNLNKLSTFLLYSVILVFLSACNREEEKVSVTENKSVSEESNTSKTGGLVKKSNELPNFFISGNVKDGFNASLVVEANTSSGVIRIAQAYTDAKGDFSISGVIEGMGLYQLRLEEQQKSREQKVIPLTLDKGDSLKLALDFNTFNSSPIYSGTRWSSPMNTYIEEMNQFTEWQKSLVNPKQYDNETLMNMVLKEKASMDEFSLKSIKKDPSNPINIILMSNLMPMMGFEYWEESQLDGLKELKRGFEEAYPTNPMTLNIAKQVDQVEKDYKDYINFTKNNIAPEISLQNPEGEVLNLTDLRGKYVLIDFWASWCGPCRMENPNVVRVYNEYKDKNFDIFSVSLDQDMTKWKKAIAADGLSWPNHVSDLQGWNSAVVPSYGIKGIPHTVLIDPEGKIVATNLRGPMLEKKLKEVL